LTTGRDIILLIAALAAMPAHAEAHAKDQARERASAPIELASRAAPVVHAPSVETSTNPAARRVAATSLHTAEVLYGYGRAARPTAALLDLRATSRTGLRAETAASVVLSDAFDDRDAPETPARLVAADDVADATAQAASRSAPPPQTGAYFVQVGAFADPGNAERVRSALLDVAGVSVDVREGPSVTLHRVRLGQWSSRAQAELVRDMVIDRGFVGAVVSAAR